MADGHVEYWKWKGRETIKMPRELWPAGSIFLDLLEDDYEPKTEDGKRGKNVTFYVQDGTYIWFSDCFPGKVTIRLIEGGSPCRYILIRVMK